MKTSLKIVLALAIATLTVASCWMKPSEKPQTNGGDTVKIDTNQVKIDTGSRVLIDTIRR